MTDKGNIVDLAQYRDKKAQRPIDDCSGSILPKYKHAAPLRRGAKTVFKFSDREIKKSDPR